MIYTEQLQNLIREALTKVTGLIQDHGTQSKFQQGKCFRIEDDDFAFNLDDGGRYLFEITEEILIDNHGYTYSFYCLDAERLFMVIDHLIEKYQNYAQI